MSTYIFNAEELLQWRSDGFVIRRGVFSAPEVERLLQDAPMAGELL